MKICTYPQGLLAYDGCKVHYGFIPPFHASQVLVHEIGHWLGLRHTFQEDSHIPANSSCLCQGRDNDLVSDTPIHLNPQAFLPGILEPYKACQPMSTCNVSFWVYIYMAFLRCNGMIGVADEMQDTDPVLNYMNYMPPKCMKEFTKSQVWLMRTWWQGRVMKAQDVDLGSGL